MLFSAQESARAVGAITPFVSYEAETGTLGGGATISSLSAPPTTEYSSPELEASGHAYVRLNATNQYVEWTNNTGKNITAINVRASIPDAPGGGGTTATLDLYVNGTFRQTITLTSTQTWGYEGNNHYNNESQNPADGNPRTFFDEIHTFVTGAAIAPGSTLRLQKNAANAAAFYYIDVVDVEQPPAALSQPANSLSITSYGAVANNSGIDNSTAIQNCINAAQSQGKSVWIPAGTFYVRSVNSLQATGITIQGAGMWYSTIYRNLTLPVSGSLSPFFNVTSCTVRNFALDSNSKSRTLSDGAAGAMDTSGTNWLAENIWTQHTLSGFWAGGTGGTVRNCRLMSIWADGCNINNTLGGIGNNLTVENNFARGTGDDAFAIYAAVDGTHQQMQNPTVINNTAIAPWGGKGVAIYGGKNVSVQNNFMSDTARYIGLGVGYYFMNASIEGAVVQNNVILRCGGNGYLEKQSALDIGTEPPSFYTSYQAPVQNISGAVVIGNTISNPVFGAINIHTCSNTVIQNNVLSSPSSYGISVDSSAVGNAILNNNTLANLYPNQSAFFSAASQFKVNTSSGVISSAILAASYNSMSGIQTENCSEGGLDVAYIGTGSYTVYNNLNLNAVTSFVARVASPYDGGVLTIRLDSPTGPVIGTCTVLKTGGWQTYATQIVNVSGASGVHNVYLVSNGGFNLEWFAFQQTSNVIQAASYNSISSAQAENSSEGGQNIGYIASGSYTVYNNINLNDVSAFQARVASAGSGGNIQIRLDSPTGTLIGTCPVPVTGGWQSYVTQTCVLNGASGYHNLYLVYTGGSGYLFNIEWFALEGAFNGTEVASYNSGNSVGTENCSEGGLDVYFNGPNPYTVHNNINLTGITSFAVKVASPGAGNTITLRLDSPTGPVIGTCTLPSTGGYQNWATATCNLSSGASGYHNIYLCYGGSFNVEWFTFQGNVNATAASNYSSLSGSNLFLESCAEGGQDLADLQLSNYAVYNNISLTGMTSFQARVASNNTGGSIQIRLDSPTGALIGTCSFGGTGGWQTWVTQTCALSGASGTHNIYLVVSGGNGFNLEWFAFR